MDLEGRKVSIPKTSSGSLDDVAACSQKPYEDGFQPGSKGREIVDHGVRDVLAVATCPGTMRR